MDKFLELIAEYQYLWLVIGAFLLFWLAWLPRVLAPLLAPHYDKLSGKVKSFIALVLPTIEKIMLNGWDKTYTEIIKPANEQTATDLDDRVWKAIDDRIHKIALDREQKRIGYFPVVKDEHEISLHG